jgi:hypothetical protein
LQNLESRGNCRLECRTYQRRESKDGRKRVELVVAAAAAVAVAAVAVAVDSAQAAIALAKSLFRRAAGDAAPINDERGRLPDV